MRAGTLDQKRVSAAMALGHEAAALVGVRAADLPLDTPPTDAEMHALGEVATDDHAAFQAATEPLRRYQRRVEAVLDLLADPGRLVVTSGCVRHVSEQVADSRRDHVQAALALAERWPSVSSKECGALDWILFEASEVTDPSPESYRVQSVLLAAKALVGALGSVALDTGRLASAIDNAVRGVPDEAAEIAWQTERLCAALLGLD
jgi:hypothetical protein